MSSEWRGGGTRRWRRIRELILANNAFENQGRCTVNVGEYCPRHRRKCPGICTGIANQVHHVKGKAFGDDPKWLVPACKECNLHIGLPTAVSPEPRPFSKW